MVDDSELKRRADAFGVATSYYDARGEMRFPSEEAVRSILAVLGNGTYAGPDRVQVVRAGHAATVEHACDGGSDWRLLQDGRVVASGPCRNGAAALPDDLAIGSYRLAFEGADGGREQPVLVAPAQAWQPKIFDEGGRLWAFAVQLYGVRSRRNWGIGDFTDLDELVRIAGELGAAGVALNPLHAISFDDPGFISPYSPTSRLFLNALYIDVEAVPEFPGLAAAGLADEVERLRDAPQVDYAGVIAAKLQALRLSFDAFRMHATPTRRAAFTAFKSARGAALTRFAAFAVLRQRYRGPWWEWPPEWCNPTDETIATLDGYAHGAMDFHIFLQWIADAQLAACAETAARLGMPVGLYLDVAVGVSADSADVWSNQGAYVRELSAGAPPDLLNTAGQDWGLASFNPRVLAATDFQLLRQTLRAVMRHAGAIRLDHVLGFNRLYLIPQGFKPDQGTYVRFPLTAMLAVVAQESQRQHCVVIGEDLGTVPDGFRETLAEWNVWSYRILLFERARDSSFKPPEAYPAQALVSFSTHDLPTFAGWLSRHDLAVKHGLGLDPGESDDERRTAHHLLWEALHGGGAEQMTFAAVVRFLARTPSRLLVVAAEDAFGIEDQPNVPGTINEHPNWRQKLPVMLEDFRSDARLREVAGILRREGRAFAA